LTIWRSLSMKCTLVIMLVAMTSPLHTHAQTAKFTDIKGHWASDTIAWAVHRHIVSGYPDGTFRPNNSVSEPEFLLMLLKAYPDMIIPELSNIKTWYEPYYLVGKDYNWPLLHEINGKPFNRGNVAHLLAATQGSNLSMQAAVQYVLDHGIANGQTSASLAGFGIQDKLKRSEALTLIKNMVDSDLVLVKAKGDIIPVSNATFTVRGISIGDSKQQVIDQLGKPMRTDLSEYGFDWYIYNQDYTNYVQVGVYKDRVVGLYSNVDNWSTKSGIKLGSSSAAVEKAYGQELTSITKGNTKFQINRSLQDESPSYQVDGSYVNFFLDKHKSDTVTAVQIIDKDMEMSLQSFYGEPSDELRISFERQVFDLANSVRVRFGKNALIWSDQIAVTARKHSKDMAAQDYFAHNNVLGLSPFDRMDNDGIKYSRAAENIAAGQTSAIFAHEGWMNSKGHRVNILSDIERLGVGVYFGGSYETYYTQNFYTPLNK
jgi:uncharacterized protein YkwD